MTKKGKGGLQGQWRRQCEGGGQQRWQGLQGDGNGDGDKDGGQVECNRDKEVDGNGDEGGGHATLRATKRAMVTVCRKDVELILGTCENMNNNNTIPHSVHFVRPIFSIHG